MDKNSNIRKEGSVVKEQDTARVEADHHQIKGGTVLLL